MRKFFWIFLFSALFLTGCHKSEPVSGQISVVRETSAETETETLSIEMRASLFRISENQHIYDEASALTEEVFSLHNDYLEWIASTRLVNAFLVITDNLNGLSPEQFASEYYQAVANPDNPDGFLVLLNNDTNQDYIFTAGICQEYLSEEEIAVRLSGASRDLIEKNYPDALNLILPLAEQIPAYTSDEADAP
ncbi:MAG: TPM domain-containing protein [Oscillospiraceae bacterium]|nr:TPM domain-containing protein [Oscillospiraceae bacterium]